MVYTTPCIREKGGEGAGGRSGRRVQCVCQKRCSISLPWQGAQLGVSPLLPPRRPFELFQFGRLLFSITKGPIWGPEN